MSCPDNKKGPVLIGCEESGTLTTEFRENGYEAYSCDLEPTRGNPEWHYKDDVKKVIKLRNWGLIILHPDCTALALSGNSTYAAGKKKHSEREAAIKWTVDLWNLAKRYTPKLALENPLSVIFGYLDYEQLCYVQPWMFGDGEVKKTGLALKGLPPLLPEFIAAGRVQRVHNMGPSETRKRDRSKTYPGIARAIVNQWGPLI